MFWVLLGAFAIVMVMAIFISRSPVQREAIAGRDQHLVASTVGVPVFRMRVTMFVLGSVVAGAAGSLFVHWKTFASPDSFGIDLGLGIFVMLILGGIDSRWGPILGAFFYVFIPQWLQGGVLGIPGPEFSVTLQGQVHNASDFKNIIFGALLVIVMIAYPEGLVGIGRGVRGLVVGGARPARRTWFSDLLGLTPKQGTAARNGAARTRRRRRAGRRRVGRVAGGRGRGARAGHRRSRARGERRQRVVRRRARGRRREPRARRGRDPRSRRARTAAARPPS